MKRLREEASGRGKLVDATQGRRTRSIIITDSDHVILSAIQSRDHRGAARYRGTGGGRGVSAEGVRGIPFVVAAPSGTGKTTVCREIVKSDARVVFSVSHTTRAKREGEVDGRDYHFVTPDAFRRKVNEEAFLEWAIYNDHHYGTSWASIEEPLSLGRDVLLEIEVQGARQVRERRRDARLILLLPPALEILEQRLRKRGTDTEEAISRRLDRARAELEVAELFDYAVVNDEVSDCVERVLRILEAERSGDCATVRREFAVRPAVEPLRVHMVGP